MVFGYAGAAATESKSSLTHVWLPPTIVFFYVGLNSNWGWTAISKKQLHIAFHAFSPLSHHRQFSITFPTVPINFPTITLKHYLTTNCSQKLVDQCYHWSKLPYYTFLILFLHVFYLSLTTNTFLLPLSITILYPPKFFLLQLQINVTIDLLNSHFLPQIVPLSCLLLQQPCFYFAQKPPMHRTTSKQTSSPLSLLFSKQRSKT